MRDLGPGTERISRLIVFVVDEGEDGVTSRKGEAIDA